MAMRGSGENASSKRCRERPFWTFHEFIGCPFFDGRFKKYFRPGLAVSLLAFAIVFSMVRS